MVFDSSFVEKDGHGILNCNCIDVLKVFLMVGIGILKLVSSNFIDGMCVVALAPAVMTIRGSTFHPLAAILAISCMYVFDFLLQLFMVRICRYSM